MRFTKADISLIEYSINEAIENLGSRYENSSNDKEESSIERKIALLRHLSYKLKEV